MSWSLMVHISIVLLALIAVAVLWVIGKILIDRPDRSAEHAGNRHSWPTPGWLWRTFRDQDWAAPSPRLHLAGGLSIDYAGLPCFQPDPALAAPLEPLPPMNLPGPEQPGRSAGVPPPGAGEPPTGPLYILTPAAIRFRQFIDTVKRCDLADLPLAVHADQITAAIGARR